MRVHISIEQLIREVILGIHPQHIPPASTQSESVKVKESISEPWIPGKGAYMTRFGSVSVACGSTRPVGVSSEPSIIAAS